MQKLNKIRALYKGTKGKGKIIANSPQSLDKWEKLGFHSIVIKYDISRVREKKKC